MQNQLKPCPFCGGEATVYYAQGNDIVGIPCFGVACDNCKIMIGTVEDGTTDFYRTPEEAVEAWNARKPMERIVEQLEKASPQPDAKIYAHENEYTAAFEMHEKCVDIVKGGAE